MEKETKVNEPGRLKIDKAIPGSSQTYMAIYSDLLQGLKRKTFVRSGFSTDRTLISASAVLYCRLLLLNMIY